MSNNPARTPTPARELAARALCRFHGLSEDATTQGEPGWQKFLDEVDIVLEAATLPPDGSTLEYIPVQAYHFLRRLSLGPIGADKMHGVVDEGLVKFLMSRGLAEEADGMLRITMAGKAIGEIEDER